MSNTIGLVVPGLVHAGGVSGVARFLCRVIEASEDFRLRVFSVPAYSRDPASVRLRAPRSWLKGARVETGEWAGRAYQHVGARWVELEFQRYRPRAPLTALLEECDLVQVVAGNPAWGLVAREVSCPIALQIATFASAERAEYFRRERGPLALWRRGMTKMTDRLDQVALDTVDRVFVENEWMEREAGRCTEAGKVVRAHPGVDTGLFEPANDTNETGETFILSVGRFADRRKNVGLLFRAYAQLAGSFDPLPELVLVGRSPPSDTDWQLAEDLDVRDRISFHGEVPRSDLAEFYRSAAVFVLPSAEEGLGLVLLEAMASGVPVVATATAGAREAVRDGETGLITPLGEPDPLAESLARLLEDQGLRKQMGHAARTHVERHFSYRVASERFLGEYRSMLDHGNQKS